MKPNPVSLVPTELACSHMFHVLGEALTLLLPPNPNPGVIQGGGAARGRHQRRGRLGGCDAALCAGPAVSLVQVARVLFSCECIFA